MHDSRRGVRDLEHTDPKTDRVVLGRKVPPSERLSVGTYEPKDLPQSLRMFSPVAAWRRLCAKTGGNIALGTFYRWVRNGQVYSIRMGGKIFVPESAVDDLVRHCLTGERL